MNNDLLLVYITCANDVEAEKIGRVLIEEKLAGCINILGEVKPIYHWPPKSSIIETSKESVLIAKTLVSKYETLKKKVEDIHSYDTPCIIAIPTYDVSDKYYKWIKGEIG